jgi:PIN domain nuclease of toxin-antitoxin system
MHGCHPTVPVRRHSPANEKWVSPASYWEIAIKISVGKYALAQPYEDFWRNAIDANGFRVLNILPRHTSLLTTLQFHHRDPFDRLIVAQALAEGMTLVSADPGMDVYSVPRVW